MKNCNFISPTCAIIFANIVHDSPCCPVSKGTAVMMNVCNVHDDDKKCQHIRCYGDNCKNILEVWGNLAGLAMAKH